ncbi:MFS transporter [Sphingobium sp. EP60837]|uniref:MFS transporter n=1 Tax=Sphingobium sp. EP60837 TaxID=1855519 RepID=UPI0009EF5645|nr:MFS transporter [Sphingobium sp. EP60837]
MTDASPTSARPKAIPAIMGGIASALAPNVMPLLVATFSNSFALSPAAAGRVTAIEMLGVCTGSLLIAIFLSRASVARLMSISLGLIIVGNLLTIAVGPQSLPLLRFIAGLGEGGGTAAMAAVLAGTATPERFFGIFIIGTYLLGTLLFRFNPVITDAGGVLAIFWILTALAALALPVAFLTRKAESSTVDQSGAPPARSHMIYVVIALAAMILYLTAWTNTWAYAVNIAQWAGMDPQSTSEALGYAVVAGAAGAILAVIIGPRLGDFIPMLGAGSLMISAALLLIVQLSSSTFTFAVMAWIAGMQFIGPYFLAIVSAADREGRAASLSIAAQTLGIAIGPALGSLVVSRGEVSLLVGVSLALLLPSLFALLMVERLLSRGERHAVHSVD